MFLISFLLILLIGLIAIYIREFVLDWQKYRALEKQIEVLTQEIETLKRQQIIQP